MGLLGWGKGLQRRVHNPEFMLALLVINACTTSHTHSCEPTFAPPCICLSRPSHDARTTGNSSSSLHYFFFLLTKGAVGFHCYCLVLGDSPRTCPVPSLHGRRAAPSPCPRTPTRGTNTRSCLFIGVRWRSRKLNRSTKRSWRTELRGPWSQLTTRSLFETQEREKKRRKKENTAHSACDTFENISMFPQWSSRSTNGSVHRKCKNAL